MTTTELLSKINTSKNLRAAYATLERLFAARKISQTQFRAVEAELETWEEAQ